MKRNQEIADEIIENMKLIPVECQEHILDVVRAMVFTRNVMRKEREIKNGPDEQRKKETA